MNEDKIRPLLDDLIESAKGTSHPSTTAYNIAQDIDLEIEGRRAIDLLLFFEQVDVEVPSEFTVYIEMEDGSLAERHKKAMARRTVEQVIYEGLAYGNTASYSH